MTGAALGTAGPSPLWYATRATGVVALVLLTVTVVLGVAGTARVATPRWPRVVTAGLHRNVALLVVAFVGVHVLTTVLDTYAPIGLISVVVPFTSAYRPLWLSLGTIAFDLLLALVITSLLRARLGYRGWRLVHWFAYVAWPVALWHGLGTGTDSRLPWLLALDAAAVAAVACAVWWRLSLPEVAPRPLTMAVAVTAVPLITIMFTLLGPLQPGWARRAGTPVRLLAGQSATAGGGAGPSASPSSAWPAVGRPVYRPGVPQQRSGPGPGDDHGHGDDDRIPGREPHRQAAGHAGRCRGFLAARHGRRRPRWCPGVLRRPGGGAGRAAAHRRPQQPVRLAGPGQDYAPGGR